MLKNSSGKPQARVERKKKNPGEFQGSVIFDSTSNSGGLDLDFLRRLLRLGLFGQFHSEHALLEACFDLVGVNTLWQFKAALERAEAALLQVIVLLFSSFSSCLS